MASTMANENYFDQINCALVSVWNNGTFLFSCRNIDKAETIRVFRDRAQDWLRVIIQQVYIGDNLIENIDQRLDEITEIEELIEDNAITVTFLANFATIPCLTMNPMSEASFNSTQVSMFAIDRTHGDGNPQFFGTANINRPRVSHCVPLEMVINMPGNFDNPTIEYINFILMSNIDCGLLQFYLQDVNRDLTIGFIKNEFEKQYNLEIEEVVIAGYQMQDDFTFFNYPIFNNEIHYVFFKASFFTLSLLDKIKQNHLPTDYVQQSQLIYRFNRSMENPSASSMNTSVPR